MTAPILIRRLASAILLSLTLNTPTLAVESSRKMPPPERAITREELHQHRDEVRRRFPALHDRLRRGKHDAPPSGESTNTDVTETLAGQSNASTDKTTTKAAVRDINSLLGQQVKPRTASNRSAAPESTQ